MLIIIMVPVVIFNQADVPCDVAAVVEIKTSCTVSQHCQVGFNRPRLRTGQNGRWPHQRRKSSSPESVRSGTGPGPPESSSTRGGHMNGCIEAGRGIRPPW